MNKFGKIINRNLKRPVERKSRENKNFDFICKCIFTQRKWKKKYEYNY